MEKETKNRIAIVIISLLFLTISLVLEILPSSLRVVFSGSNDVKYFSYFDIRPIGYAIITPFLSSLATIACIVLFAIRLFKPYKMKIGYKSSKNIRF